jgi:preprotein translocase subunit SecG
MFTFLLVLHAIIAAALVTVILMQKSEGGGLTSGGSPSGLMSARGAADFLTRSTAILAGAFVLLSIALAVLAATRQSQTVDVSAARPLPSAPPVQTAPPPAADGSGLAGAAQAVQAENAAAPAAPDNGVPLAR